MRHELNTRQECSDKNMVTIGSCEPTAFGWVSHSTTSTAPLFFFRWRGGGVGGRERTARHRLEESLNLGSAPRKGLVPEAVLLVLDERDKGDEQPPRVRAVHDEALDEHARDLLLHLLILGSREDVQDGA